VISVRSLVLPDWHDIAIEDDPAHRAGALRHRGLLEPALAELAKAPGLLEPTLLALLLLGRRTPLRDGAPGIEALLPGTRQGDAGITVTAQREGLAPPIETVVVPEDQTPRWRHGHVHAVAIRDLVHFPLYFRCLSAESVSMARPPLRRNTVGLKSTLRGRLIVYFQTLSRLKIPSEGHL
jgi:hypothetical protein